MYNTREEVASWLKEMKINNYVINEDLTVDVKGDVNLIIKDLTVDVKGDVNLIIKGLSQIPIQFGIIDGSFNCSWNSLTSLKGCPKVVNGYFYCYNNSLTSLEGCPEVVNGSFYCNNNKLISFEFFPQEINGNSIFLHNIEIKEEEELVNFDCKMENIEKIYSDFNEYGNVEEFLNKVNYYKNIKKENELLKELSVNSNNVKLNKKL